MSRLRFLAIALVLPTLGVAESSRVEVVVALPAPDSQQAIRRLQLALAEQGCEARTDYSDPGYAAPDSPTTLTFRYQEREGLAPPADLIAVNRKGELPVPVWVTRRTAGVRTLAELEDRDLAVVADDDPIGARQPLAALAEAGVRWAPGQIYQTRDFGSAVSLLLHNNTHAAASEQGLVGAYLDNQGLEILWRGEPVRLGGWYRGAEAAVAVDTCLAALQKLDRDSYPQAFRAFPEWIHSFRMP